MIRLDWTPRLLKAGVLAVAIVASSGVPAPAAEAVAPQGTLNVGVLTDVTDFDPWNIRTGNFSVLPQLYDSLFYYDDERELRPQLATGFTFNDDNTAITVTLRDGVKFHSGAAFDAHAVAAMLEQAKDPGNALGELAIVDSWEVTGPTEIVMRFSTPIRASIVEDMLAYFPIPDPTRPADFDWKSGDAGSGPYVLTERIAGERIVLAAFDDYWDKTSPRAAEVVMTIFSDSAAATNALETGVVDVLYNAATQDAARLQSQGFLLESGPGPFLLGLHISPFRPPFDNQLVRQAMLYVIPREGVSRAVFSGLSEPTGTVFVPGSPGYSEAYTEQYAYDLDKARQLLDESGLSDAELSQFEILVPSNRPYNQGLAEIVQAELAKIGVDVEIDLRDTAEAGAMIVSGDFAMTSTNLSRLHKDPASIVSSGALQIENNYVLHDQVFPDYIEAIERVTAALDDEELAAATENLRRVLAERAWIIPCCTSPQGLTLSRDEIEGVRVTNDNMLDIRSVSIGG